MAFNPLRTALQNVTYVSPWNPNPTAAPATTAFVNLGYTKGYVGIGTTSPLGPLQVISNPTNVSGTVGVGTGTSNVTGSGTNFLTSFKAGDTIGIAGLPSRTVSAVSSSTALTVTLNYTATVAGASYTTFPNVAFTSLQNGLVGIGTTNPSSALHVLGRSRIQSVGSTDTSAVLELFANGTTTGSYFYANNSGSLVMTPATGNVGIGTTNPGVSLDVNGGLRSYSSGSGYIQLNYGSVSNPGYIAFHQPNGTRVGYIGWQATSGYLALETENGYSGYEVTGNLNVGGKVQEGGNSLIPRGVIVMWTGSTAPTGWALCDGNNGTPNLQNRFILGPGTRAIGTTGGEETHTLTIAEMPSHTHGITIDGSRIGGGGGAAGNVAFGYDYNVFYANSYHIQNTGDGGAHNNMPPFYVLAYIMKL